ncbi:MAG: CU044_5270 family protein, partial [Solirubrobacterales bacterium]
LIFRRRRLLLAFAGATAIAAAVAGILVLSSGPTAQPAAAEILHKTAAVAAATDAPAEIPGPGQFFYRKFKRLELESWIPVDLASADEPLGMGGGVLDRPGAFKALMPTTQEWWTAPDGAGRTREVAGTPRFLTSEEQSRWEATGSRLPPPFDPEYQRKYPLAFGDALEARRGVVDTEHPKLERFHFPDTSSLPTEPEALRHAVENNQISVHGFNLMYPSAKRLDTERTIAELFNILSEGNPSTAQLRAAAFNALAELPGIEVDTDATDFLGRHGYAIRSIDPKTGGGIEFIFDPDTSEMLAERGFLGDRGQGPYEKGLPAGLTIRETAYLESAVVDSTDETGAEAEAGGPVATTGPTYRK